MNRLELGAKPLADGDVQFTVWAPRTKTIVLKLIQGRKTTLHPLKHVGEGYYQTLVKKPGNQVQYLYRVDGVKERPDPVSRFQPKGVHGPSQVMDFDYAWSDKKWSGLAMKDIIFYELHAGIFTREGTLEAIIKKIPYLKKLGVNCIEIMPVAEFAGKRNWGYDGVGLFAVAKAYGGPGALKKLVNACHREGIGVCLDVVYNHLGPEGNYLEDFGPYFTDRYRTPWGKAVNFDDKDNKPVRHFVVQNALYWIKEFHIDALRLDAVHGIHDRSREHILAELKSAVEAESRLLKRRVLVIAESDMNASRIVRPRTSHGYGLDSQWSDDFHHAVHKVLTGEKQGYYQDYKGLESLAKVLAEGFVYQGQYSAFRRKEYGDSTENLSGERFVVCVQNHDQVGNRALGERLSMLTRFEAQKLAATLLLMSPYVPLLFMGQEYGETNPFYYFIDHGNPDLVKRVREGRRRELAAYGWKKTVDPKRLSTFKRSKLNWKRIDAKPHRFLLNLYRDLIELRKQKLNLGSLNRSQIILDYDEKGRWLMMAYPMTERKKWVILFSFSGKSLKFPREFPSGRTFHMWLTTSDKKYGGRTRIKDSPVAEAEELVSESPEITLEPMSAMIGELI